MPTSQDLYELEEDYYPRRLECCFILGVASILEPSVQSLLIFAGSLTTDLKQLVKA